MILAYFIKDDGKGGLTYCKDSETCNHIAHIEPGEDPEDFFERAEALEKKLLHDYLWHQPARIKIEMVKRREHLDELKDDYHWEVRKFMVEQRLFLEHFMNDSYDEVRIAVAKQGYGTDRLLYDKEQSVRTAAEEYRIAHKLKTY